jgi:hypothetical protein
MGRVRVPVGSAWGDTMIFIDGTPRAVTGDDGTFVVLGVEAGQRTVSAERAGALTSQVRVTVRAGQLNNVGETLLVLGEVYPDGIIDQLDWLMVTTALGRCRGDADFQSWLDIDRDGCITTSDRYWVELNLGRVGPTAWSLTP